jgi:hypothetical protein
MFPIIFDRPRRRIAVAGGVAVTVSNGEIGDVNSVTVEITFSEAIFSTNYANGVTIRVNAVPATISSATRQDPNKALVYYVLSAAVDINDIITFEYDNDFGDYETDPGGVEVDDIASTAITNFVGSHYYFDEKEDSMWMMASVN